MEQFTFEIKMTIAKRITDEELDILADNLFDSGCSDSLLISNDDHTATHEENISLHFDRHAESFKSAVTKAKASIKKAFTKSNLKYKIKSITI